MKKVKITRLPQLPQAKFGMSYFNQPMGGTHPAYRGAVLAPGTFLPVEGMYEKPIEVNNTLKPVDRENATLEAEKGETVVTNLDKGGIPEFYTIGGKRHYAGGTPLNLPPDSFIFSRDRKLKIKDKDILAQFGKNVGKKGKKGFTPAELSKKYNLNYYQQILADPTSDRLMKDTAEMMIQNYNLKLGGLAMVQESMKGFPDGIPAMAQPYLDAVGIDPESLISPPDMGGDQGQGMARYGGAPNAQAIRTIEPKSNVQYMKQGGLVKMQGGGQPLTPEELALARQYGINDPGFSPEGTRKAIQEAQRNAWVDQQMQPPTGGMGEWPPTGGFTGGMQPPAIGADGIIYDAAGNPTGMPLQSRGSIGNRKGMKGLPKGSRVRPNAQGSYDIVDRGGNIIGTLSTPAGPTYPAATTSTRSTKRQNIPKKARKWDMNEEGYDETAVQPGDYILKEDGKWYQATGFQTKSSPFEVTDPDERLAGSNTDLNEAYGRMASAIQDNPELRSEIIKRYRKNIEGAKPNKKGLSEAELQRARDMKDDEIIDNFLRMEKQVMAINAHKGNINEFEKKDQWDTDRSNYENMVSELGFTPLTPGEGAAFQAAYIGLNDLQKEGKFKDVLSDFQLTQKGVGDESIAGEEAGTISQIDGWIGNTTAGQAMLYAPTAKELQTKEAAWEEIKDVKHLPDSATPPPADSPFWLQDIVQTAGAARDFFGVKKYSPWEAMAATKLAQPTFMDPTRQLAANAELANIATQGAGMFAGPQALAARSAQIQGQAAQNAANTLATVNNQNVGIANQFAMQNAQIMNVAGDRNAQIATRLFDKNTIANQQFDNAKNQARQQLRQNYVNALTNRAQTQAMNQLYDQYNIDPLTGGFMHFTQGKKLTPTKAQQTGVMDIAQGYRRENPGLEWKDAIAAAKADMGQPSQVPGAGYGMDPSQFAYPGGMPTGYYPG